MELIFAYIKKFGDYIYEQSIPLSNNFEVRLENKILTVQEKKNYFHDFYGNGIKNLSVFVGKNGSGKTTVLDIFGMKRRDRLISSADKNKVTDEYLLLYYIGKDDEGQGIFGIEVLGSNVFYDMFTNYDRGGDDDRYDKEKTSIGLVFKYNDGQFISIGKHFFNYITNGEKLSDMMGYAYLNESYRYSPRNERYGIYNHNKEDYIAERKMYPHSNVYTKYLSICQCIKNEIEGFDLDKVKVILYDKIDYNYLELSDEYYRDQYEDTVEEIQKMLPLWVRINIFSNQNTQVKETSRKEKYIIDLYARYILDMLVNDLYPLCKDERRTKRGRTERVEADVMRDIEYIMNLQSSDSSYERLGEPADFGEELSRVKKVILYLKDKFGEINRSCLKILARYVGSRIHEVEENTDFGYVDILEQMIGEMFGIPEQYFQKDGIEFLVNESPNPYLEKYLEKFSYWEQIKDHWNSDIGNKFKVDFAQLSEGEERFIDIIAKIRDSIIGNKEKEFLILIMDEPDQALHPEWSRRFIEIMVQALEHQEFAGDIQLMLSTHSPYLLSDILPSNVFLLKRLGSDRRLMIQRMDMSNGTSCLGANIYDLMKNQFFMENTVGEFITRKLNNLANEIDQLAAYDNENIAKIESLIDQIGEAVIRSVLKKNLNEKKEKLKLLNNKQNILEMITNHNDKQKVQEFLDQLEGRSYDRNQN